MNEKTDPWAAIRYTATGEEVAVDQLTLFFNNNTVMYGMTLIANAGADDRESRLEALTAGGFSQEMAEAFLTVSRKNHWL